MTAKEYLERVKHLNEYINELIEKQSEALNTACGGAVCTSNDRVQSGGLNTTEDRLIKYADFKMLIDKKIDEYVNVKRQVARVIFKLDKPMERQVLILRYLCFKSWGQIKAEMGCKRNVFYIHNNALKKIKQYIV